MAVAKSDASTMLVLAGKDKESFKIVVDCYEKKNFYKGLKYADFILKKHPNHGETQSMKGLLLNCMDRKEEAYKLAKDGIANDVRSHICWHVYGLLHRSDRNYLEGIKCYQNALKIDSTNQNILRDLSWLQIQVRDMPGYLETRKTIFDSTKNSRSTWMTLSIANFLNKKYAEASDNVSALLASTTCERGDKYEESELLLFQNRCLETIGSWGALEDAISHLNYHKAAIKDKLSWHTKMGELYLLTGRYDEARKKWTALVHDQPDNYRLHSGLQLAYLEVDKTDCKEMLQSLKKLELPSTVLTLSREQLHCLRDMYRTNNFKSKFIRNICLTLYDETCPEDSDDFKALLDEHMRHYLRKGMPALYHDIASLVRIPDPLEPSRRVYPSDPLDFSVHPLVKLVRGMVDTYVRNLRDGNSFDKRSTGDEDGDGSDNTSSTKEPPHTLLWALFLQSHLQDICGQYEEALQTIDACIQHTPTALDMYSKKARILKKLGALEDAVDVMDECRSLDLQDRYLNNKTTKYMLRADQMETAIKTIGLFTRCEGDVIAILLDLQCNWYEVEAAESYARTKQWGPSLKKFNAVKKHFNDYQDDIFDFHAYTVRKTTIRAYLNALFMIDDAYAHKFFQRATCGALRLFCHLLDCPEDIDGLGHLPPAERKKVREKMKKQKKKDEAAAAAKAEEEARLGKEKKEEINVLGLPPDLDPQGEKLMAKPGEFLPEAVKWTELLAPRLSLCHPETLGVMAEVRMRAGHFSKAVEMLQMGIAKDAFNPHVTPVLVKLALRAKQPATKKGPSVGKEVKQSVVLALGGAEGENVVDVDSALIDAFIIRCKEHAFASVDLTKAVGACKCIIVQAGAAPYKAEVHDAVSSILVDGPFFGAEARNSSAKAVTAALLFLETAFDANSAIVTTFREKALTKYPRARALQQQVITRDEGK